MNRPLRIRTGTRDQWKIGYLFQCTFILERPSVTAYVAFVLGMSLGVAMTLDGVHSVKGPVAIYTFI